MLCRKEQDYEYSKIQIPLYPPTIQNYRRGSALLAVVLILAVVSSVMSIGTAKITQAAINSTGSNKTTLQAQQYAASEAELLRSTNYSDLKAQNKQSISDSGFQKEIVLSDETDLSGGLKKRDVTVNIYSNSESLPRATVNFIRYKVPSSSTISSKVFSIPKDGSVTYTLPGNISHLSVLAITDFDTHGEGTRTNTVKIGGIGTLSMDSVTNKYGSKGHGWEFDTSQSASGDYKVSLAAGSTITISTSASSGAAITHTTVLLIMS